MVSQQVHSYTTTKVEVPADLLGDETELLLGVSLCSLQRGPQTPGGFESSQAGQLTEHPIGRERWDGPLDGP